VAADAKPATGAWYGLAAIFEDKEREFGWWRSEVMATGGLACPRDGEPLTGAPSTDAGAAVTAFCGFCGWRAPRDVVTPAPGIAMGRDG
jgi:hypothetical protein